MINKIATNKVRFIEQSIPSKVQLESYLYVSYSFLNIIFRRMFCREIAVAFGSDYPNFLCVSATLHSIRRFACP